MSKHPNIKRQQKKERLKLLFVLLISGLLFVHFYLPRFIVEINNPLLSIIRKNNVSNTNQTLRNSKSKELIFTSFDKTKLSAYLTYTYTDTVKGTIILLHGIRSNKEHFKMLSQKLSKVGYNSVALDLRAHGQSEGKYCTFGVKEKYDIVELISILEKSEITTDKIGVLGQSLGGAVGIQTMGIDKRIKFGIIESTFSDFKVITNDYFSYHLGINPRFLTNYLIKRAGKIAEFNPNDAKPRKYCKTIKQPILIVHGKEDKRIHIKYARENFSNIKSDDKEFIELKNANHTNVWETGGEKYFEKIVTFMDRIRQKK